jgi:hypothetical protein
VQKILQKRKVFVAQVFQINIACDHRPTCNIDLQVKYFKKRIVKKFGTSIELNLGFSLLKSTTFYVKKPTLFKPKKH